MTAAPNPPTRLPRYARAAAASPCVLTRRDLDILRQVRSFRLLTSAHVAALVEGSAQGVLRRLQRLFHDGYLDRLRPRFVDGGGSSRMTYAIANRGIRTLQKEGLIKTLSQTDLDAQNRELSGLFVDHRLLVSHIRAVLTLACRATPAVRFVGWREGRRIFDRIEVPLPQACAEVPVAADGLFALQDAKGRRAHFFVEADRGSSSIKRFTLKLRAYAAYAQAQRHTERFGIKKFHVLTVTSSAARRENLAQAAAAEDDIRKAGGLFLFAADEDLPLACPQSVFAKIWTRPGTEEPCSLV